MGFAGAEMTPRSLEHNHRDVTIFISILAGNIGGGCGRDASHKAVTDHKVTYLLVTATAGYERGKTPTARYFWLGK